jgi:hypothetical protein
MSSNSAKCHVPPLIPHSTARVYVLRRVVSEKGEIVSVHSVKVNGGSWGITPPILSNLGTEWG